MSLTIAQLSERFSEELSMKIRAGEAGVGRTVNRFGVMETADFNTGAEPDGMFVLTTLSFVSENGSGLEAVRKLIRSGPAGVGIKTKRYFAEIPDQIVQCAEENRVPLFEITSDVTFSSFIRTATEAIVMDTYSMRMFKAAHYSSLAKILETLGEMLGGTCFFMDVSGDITVGHEVSAGKSDANFRKIGNQMLGKFLRNAKDHNCFYEEGAAAFPCYAGGIFLGLLVWVGPARLTEMSESIVFMTLSYIAVQICERRISQFAASVDAEQNLLSQILFAEQGNGALIKSRMKDIGFELLDAYVFVLLSVREEYVDACGPEVIEYCRSQMARRFKNSTMSWGRTSVKCLITFSDAEAPQREEDIRSRLVAFRNGELSSVSDMIDMGVSFIQNDSAELRQSYLQAQTAISLGRLYRPSKHIYSYHAFAIQGMVHRCTDLQEYRWLQRHVVDPLSERDRFYESGLWETLSVLFRVRSLKVAADELHIHISTLRYRLQKIMEITGFDYLSSYGNYVLHTAYIIWMNQKIS